MAVTSFWKSTNALARDGGTAARHDPGRQQRRRLGLARPSGMCGVAAAEAGRRGGLGTGLRPFGEAGGEREGCRWRHPAERSGCTDWLGHEGGQRRRRSAACRATARTDARSGSSRRRRAGSRSAGPAARPRRGCRRRVSGDTQALAIRRRPLVPTTACAAAGSASRASAAARGSAPSMSRPQIDDRLDRDAGARRGRARRRRRCHCW